MEHQLQVLLDEAVNDHLFPGVAAGVTRSGGHLVLAASGHFTYDAASPAVTTTSVFDVASITKSIPTSSLALKLIDDGKLRANDKVVDFIPELSFKYRENVLIRHLLTQTLSFGFRLSDQKDKEPQQILSMIFDTDLCEFPGRSFAYSNASSILLGIVVSRLLGMPLDEASAKYFFEPLKMTQTGFRPLEKYDRSMIVPSEKQDWRSGNVQGEVHDESAFVLSRQFVPGSAGLFSSVDDLLVFLRMLLNRGELDNIRYFSKGMVELMAKNQISRLGESASYGWELNQPRYMGNAAGEIFGKTGFTGCSVICNLKRDYAVVLLSNYTFPSRRVDAEPINKLRRAVSDLVFDQNDKV